MATKYLEKIASISFLMLFFKSLKSDKWFIKLISIVKIKIQVPPVHCDHLMREKEHIGILVGERR